MDVVSVSKKPEKKEDENAAKSMSRKAPLTERIMKKAATIAAVATLAVITSSCLDWNFSDADADHDADIADSDVADSDIRDGDISDGDVADSDVSDGDLGDSDVDEEAGPTTCSGVSNDSVVSENVDVGDSIYVGGYSLAYVGQVTGSDDIYIDISCAATGSDIETGIVVPIYGVITIVASLDGKNIEITNHSSSDSGARISATVSDS